jgi:hypothetical protein
MLELKLDFEKPRKIVLLGEVLNTVFLASKNEDACIAVQHIIMNIYSLRNIVFHSSGLQNTLHQTISILGDSSYVYYEGDESKFIVRKMPELYANIQNVTILYDLIIDWTSTIYERRSIFLSRIDMGEYAHQYFVDVSKRNMADNDEVWTTTDCIIENAPEAPNHNSFILTFRQVFYNDIVRQIEDFITK